MNCNHPEAGLALNNSTRLEPRSRYPEASQKRRRRKKAVKWTGVISRISETRDAIERRDSKHQPTRSSQPACHPTLSYTLSTTNATVLTSALPAVRVVHATGELLANCRQTTVNTRIQWSRLKGNLPFAYMGLSDAGADASLNPAGQNDPKRRGRKKNERKCTSTVPLTATRVCGHCCYMCRSGSILSQTADNLNVGFFSCSWPLRQRWREGDPDNGTLPKGSPR